MSYQAAVITVSDRASAGVYEDKSGPAVAAMLKEAGYEGWLVVEAEQDPAVAPSYAYAKKGHDTLRAIVDRLSA